MPKMKLAAPVKAERIKSGFEAYDGPTPSQRGVYRARLKVVKLKQNGTGSIGFAITAELEAAQNDVKNHKQFDGFAFFISSIIIQGPNGAQLKEASQNKLGNFFHAIGAKGVVDDILYDDGDLTKGVNVKKIAGKNPVNQIVNLDVVMEDFEGEKRPSANEIFVYEGKDKTERASEEAPSDEPWAEDVAVEEDEDEDYADEDGAEDEDSVEEDELRAELNRLRVPALRQRAKDVGANHIGNKPDVIDAIIAIELGADGPMALSDDEDEDDEDQEESDIAVEDDEEDEEDDEDEEDEDEEEDEEDDEEDEDREAELREELADLDRSALKTRVKEGNEAFKILKRHSDDDLRQAIVDIELNEIPF